MTSPSEKLAQSLEALHAAQQARGAAVIRARDISRTHRERLVANGFLRQVIKGWYIPTRPDEVKGESTAWYACYWAFVTTYFESRFGSLWSLAPEQSLALHSGNWTVPGQLVVRSPRADNKVLPTPHGTSLLSIRSALPVAAEQQRLQALRVFSVESALLACSSAWYATHPTDVRAALATIGEPSTLIAHLLQGGHSVVAGRLAGALRNGGRDVMADEVLAAMSAAGYNVREADPFRALPGTRLPLRERSPYVHRIRLMWHGMRRYALDCFPAPPGLPRNARQCLKGIEAVFASDAYHSLSIEGYRVSAALIDRVRTGNWDPERNVQDREQRNALAARGYFQAFQAVKDSVGKVLKGDNPGEVVRADHRTWYRQMFAPSVTAGLIRPADLAGYRNDQVYIRQSMHVPLNREAVRDAMPALFDLLTEEAHPAVRAVLGHFVFVFIHPYMDGNGRMGRFLMNVMLAAGGYPWVVIPVTSRSLYMSALERASVGDDIRPFARFLAGLVGRRLAGEPLPGTPAR
jgi:fido (protein-threonine AMPylation protein)